MNHDYHPLPPASPSSSSTTSALPPPSPDGFQRSVLKFRENQISKGQKLEYKAQKKIKGWFIFGFNYEDAAELYQKAADCYKLPKSWEKAGSAYFKQAGCYLKAKGGYDFKRKAASAYVDAGNCYEKISVTDAISCFDRAVNMYAETGSFLLSARYCQVIGNLYEVEQDIEKALIYFERAAVLFQSEKLSPFDLLDCNECKNKVAQFSAQLEKYPRAIAIYEDFAKESLNKNLKYIMRGYLLNAGLCQLFKADADAVAISNALERYEELDPTFPGTPEYKLLAELAASVVEEDVQKFTDVVKKYDSTAKQDAWKTTLLMKIEEKLKAKKMMAIDQKWKAMF